MDLAEAEEAASRYRESVVMDYKNYTEVTSERRILDPGSHTDQAFPFKRLACLPEESQQDAAVDRRGSLDPIAYRRVVNATDRSSLSSEDAQQQGPSCPRRGAERSSPSACVPLLLPNINDGGWPLITRMMERSQATNPPIIASTAQTLGEGSQSGEAPGLPVLEGLSRSSRRRERARNQPKWDIIAGGELSSSSSGSSMKRLGSITAPLRRLVTSFRSKRLSFMSMKSRRKFNDLADSEESEEDSPPQSLAQRSRHHSGLGLSRQSQIELAAELAAEPVHPSPVPPRRSGQLMEQILTKTFAHDEFPPRTESTTSQDVSSKSASGLSGLRRHRSTGMSPAASQELTRKSSAYSEWSAQEQASYLETSTLTIETFKGVTFLNEYALIKTLGKGSFGSVLLALNTKDLELYSLKLLPKSKTGNAKISDPDVLNEIRVMKSMKHQNIVRLHEVIDDPLNSKILLVMEYAEGGALFSGNRMTPKLRLTELMARKYFRDMLSGLDFLHANHVCHLDLKPQNILLSSNGRLKLADFGSSQLTRRGEVVRRTAGTPAYMAPELRKSAPYHARLADVWSLGVCLWKLVFGTLPFKGDSVYNLYESIQSKSVSFPRDIYISDSLKHLLLRLLDKSPDTRITLVGAMSHPWTTHNGALPLPSLQGLESDEEIDSKQMLMECWPDNAAVINTNSPYYFVSPRYKLRVYQDGKVLAERGDRPNHAFYVTEGQVVIRQADDARPFYNIDTEDEEARDQAKRLQDGGMLDVMLNAAVNASKHVSAYREPADDGKSTIVSRRGPGTLVGEVNHYEGTAAPSWQASVRAQGRLEVLTVSYPMLTAMRDKRPEAEADIRANVLRFFQVRLPAVQAQKQSELLLVGMLEKLASLRPLIEELKESASHETSKETAKP